MELHARKHVRGWTAILTILSLALVFGTVLGYVPETIFPRADPLIGVVPHVNVLISATAILTILYGVRSIRRGDVSRHRRAMLASTGLFFLFLALYLYRVSLEGPTTFSGPGWVRQYVYLPFLAVHILLAIVSLPLVYYALLLAVSTPVARLPDTPHPRVGRLAATFWVVSFLLGIGVWFMLHVLF